MLGLMHLKHGYVRFGCIRQLNLLVVGLLGWVQIFPLVMGSVGLGWVGLGQSADGLGWIGSHKMDPWTTLSRVRENIYIFNFIKINSKWPLNGL